MEAAQSCCVMRNAWQTLTCIAGRVAVIVHGPSGCGADLSLPDRQTFATDLGELDVIMGGEEALEAKIASVRRSSRPELIFVLGTCVSEIIGDDARGICAQASGRLGIPVLFLPTSGMVERGSADARTDVAQVLVENVMKPGRRIEGSVNFIAHPWPAYLKVKDELARHLRALGIRLNSFLAGAPALEEIARAPRAALDVVVSDEPARRVALRMREKFGIPYVLVPRPLGVGATSRMFRLAAEACGGGLRRAALVEVWRRRELRRLAEAHPGLRGRSVALAGPGPGPGLAAAFAELGVDVSAARGARSPRLDVRPPESFLMYSGMRELAGELDAELGSRFFRTYGAYCR